MIISKINTILETEEKVVWEGKINRRVLITRSIIGIIIPVVIIYFFLSGDVINYTSNGVAKTVSGALLRGLSLGILFLIIILNYISNFIKKYTITNKRVIIESGLIGTDFNSIYFTQIRNSNVNVGIIDKIFSTGSINIDTGKISTIESGNGQNHSSNTHTTYDTLSNIDNPYETYKIFQAVSSERQESLYSGK